MSLGKLLVLVLLVAAVWYGYKWVARLDRERKDRIGRAQRTSPEGQELVECPACGTYTTPGIARCPESRSDCPMTGG